MTSQPQVGIVWRGDVRAPAPSPGETRFAQIFAEFDVRGAAAIPLVYDDSVAAAVRTRLLGLDAVLVWVDPIVDGQDRTVLDGLLREVSVSGVVVSTHPDVIQSLGTKAVLHRTRDLPWGTDSRLYHGLAELEAGLAASLRASGVRVVKQDRGSSGDGVWKLELVADAVEPAVMRVLVQAAVRGARRVEATLGDFVRARREYARYFGGSAVFLDQAYCERLVEGMTRCYLVRDRVAGFGHQAVTALTPPLPGADGPPDPEPRRYYGPETAQFQPLRALVEGGWVTQLLQRLGLTSAALPVIWDMDFLLGPRTAEGTDTYVLCEINVSGVFPIPAEAVAPLVAETLERIATRRR